MLKLTGRCTVTRHKKCPDLLLIEIVIVIVRPWLGEVLRKRVGRTESKYILSAAGQVHC